MKSNRTVFTIENDITVELCEFDRRDVVMNHLSNEGCVLCGTKEYSNVCDLPYVVFSDISELYEKYPTLEYLYIPLKFTPTTSAYTTCIGSFWKDKCLKENANLILIKKRPSYEYQWYDVLRRIYIRNKTEQKINDTLSYINDVLNSKHYFNITVFNNSSTEQPQNTQPFSMQMENFIVIDKKGFDLCQYLYEHSYIIKTYLTIKLSNNLHLQSINNQTNNTQKIDGSEIQTI